MTTLAPRPMLPEFRIGAPLLAGLAWWWARFAAAWLALAARELPGVLAATLVEALRVVFVAAPVWAWRLPRENQAVLATTLAGVGMGVHAAHEAMADPRSWAQVFGPPGWVLGVCAALFIARCVTRPIVLLVPFGLVAWWISPRAAILLVALAVIAVGWTSKQRTAHGSTTSRRTITGATVVRANHDGQRRSFATGGVAPTSRFVAKHEGGHAAAAAAAGGRVVKARAYADRSGYCEAKLPCRPSLFLAVVDNVAFSVGGEVAVHSSAGCSYDHKMRDRALNMLDTGPRRMARTAGYANARRAQSTHRHVQRAVADALMKTGRYR